MPKLIERFRLTGPQLELSAERGGGSPRIVRPGWPWPSRPARTAPCVPVEIITCVNPTGDIRCVFRRSALRRLLGRGSESGGGVGGLGELWLQSVERNFRGTA